MKIQRKRMNRQRSRKGHTHDWHDEDVDDTTNGINELAMIERLPNLYLMWSELYSAKIKDLLKP